MTARWPEGKTNLGNYGFEVGNGHILYAAALAQGKYDFGIGNGSILVFTITGVHLMLVDPNYLGIGNFSNPWAILMLVKHILIIMIRPGFWFNALQRVGPAMRSNSGTGAA